MKIRKCLLVLAAAALPLSSVALLEGTATAGKVLGTGSPTCSFGGTLTFNPPLTAAGSTSVKKEVTTVSATLMGCSGGTPVPGTTAASIKPIKTKTPKGQAGATCSGFESNATTVSIKAKVKWAGEKPSKFVISHLSVVINGEGEAGFSGSFPVSGSYAGTGTVHAFLTQASSTEIATCAGSISSLQLDSSTSSGTL